MRILVIVILFLQLGEGFGQSGEAKLKISHLTGDFYIYTTYNYFNGNRTPANGMYVVTEKGAILIDSPWDTTQFQPLLDSIRVRHNTKAAMCIATHFHEDRTGGLEYYKRKGIATYTTKRTDELSKKNKKKRAEFLITHDTTFAIGQYVFKTYYPGHGHAPDNIVVWFEKEKVLYGGCLIKSTADNNLGNLGDASVNDYAAAVLNVQQKCRNPKYVVPGHNDWTNTRSLLHTFQMAEELRRNRK
ncbi:MAG TPA: BlaB/IND/MUS family subclass B1 metallo-beta-lactamase [Cyclobacteriaceae bacterium]|jgi:metallo-beta-lactamase class B|nr:BlaB/IND/MUS family subclass B1 metallo-beta-lactamase [Cyclobacteriaceae bacterium]